MIVVAQGNLQRLLYQFIQFACKLAFIDTRKHPGSMQRPSRASRARRNGYVG